MPLPRVPGGAKILSLVGLYLASGKVGAAMEWAWRGAQANKGEPESAAQVCRVFKAADLDLVRAQAFLAWVAGKGENPVPQFIAEHPVEAPVPAATLKARRERKARQKAALAGEWQDVLEAPRGVKLGLVNLGALEPQQAWEAGALPVEDTIRLIQEQRVRGWMSVPEREVIRLALGEVLDQQLAALPEKERPLVPPLVQLALADTKRKRGDAGAVPIYQELIAAAEKRNEKSFDRQSIVPLAHLAMFYSEQGQHLQAAQTWGRWKDVPTSDEWQADWRIMAARSYATAGEKDRAQQLYAEVPQYGHGWYSALSLYDQALPLIQSGKLKEAYALMSRPLMLKADKNSGIVAQNAWLADLAYRQGDLEGAMQHAKAALDAGDKGSNLFSDSVSNLRDTARDIYNRAGGWRTQPIQTDTKEVVFQTNPLQPNQPLYARFRIKTYGDTSITATVDNPAFQARVMPLNNWRREGLNAHEQEMEVVVQTSLNRPVADVPLVLSSAARGKTTTVRLSLREESPRPALSTGG